MCDTDQPNAAELRVDGDEGKKISDIVPFEQVSKIKERNAELLHVSGCSVPRPGTRLPLGYTGNRFGSATGGPGSDSFALQADPAEGEAALMDFDAAEDKMMVVYDDAGPPPDLTLEVRSDLPGLTGIAANGDVMAWLPEEDAPSLEDIVLVAHSQAPAIAALTGST